MFCNLQGILNSFVSITNIVILYTDTKCITMGVYSKLEIYENISGFPFIYLLTIQKINYAVKIWSNKQETLKSTLLRQSTGLK